MRSARSIAVLAAVVLTGLAWTPLVHAQEPTVEVTEELTGAHCPAVSVVEDIVSGGCPVHFVTEHPGISIVRHAFGIEEHYVDCPHEFTLTVDENGEGYVSDMAIAPLQCSPVELCPGAAPTQPVTVSETAPGALGFTFTICFRRVGTSETASCPLDVLMTNDFSHGSELSVTDDSCTGTLSGTSAEVDSAHWEAETAEMPEYIHASP